MVMGLAGSALAVDRTQLDNEIRNLTGKFAAMQQDANRSIPADKLQKAKGIVLLDQTKGGFLFAYHNGSGVALVKDANGQWSAPAFITSTGASFGLQAGGQKDFYAILLTTTNATDSLTAQTVNFGAAAGGTGAGASAGAQANTVPASEMMVYSEKNGYFGGAAVKGGSISPDKDANSVYYGKSVSMNGILLDHQVQPTPTEQSLINKLNQAMK